MPTTTMARLIGWSDQAVRHAIHDVHERGLVALHLTSSRPHTTHEVFETQKREQVPTLLHPSPRDIGKNRSIWTRNLAAQFSVERGMASRLVSGATIRQALGHLGVR